MNRSSPEIEPEIDTEMVDLTDVTFDELRTGVASSLEPYLNRVMSSVARSRMNIGASGPPGRDD